ncbi:MAG: diphosphate--fructose-6-phosphate 1-phosphotransferase [Bacilli bacterium]|nr:diphosphate--fructose-6-phosphate 1-phosphotransferase [Bacilli bacterium]
MGRALVYFQSGGPTSVINTSLFGVIREARLHKEFSKILGSRYGVEGLIDDHLVDLNKESDRDIMLLLQTPGAILGSSRKKLPDEDGEIYDKIVATLLKHDVGYVLVNGGNDSMDTCNKLGKIFEKRGLDIKVLGIPKTVDNDLNGSDHSLGFPSAAKFIANAVHAAVMDLLAYKKGKVLIVEMMGRDTGWLTTVPAVLEERTRPDIFLIPEIPFDKELFIKNVKEIYERKGNCVIAVSEGLEISRGDLPTDEFGHAALSGVSDRIDEIIKAELGYGTRIMNLSLTQRSAPYLTSLVDQEEAIDCSKFAVNSLLKGYTRKAIAIKRMITNSTRYQYEPVLIDTGEVANNVRKMPTSYIKDMTKVDESFTDYLAPLIRGEIELHYYHGVLEMSHFQYIKDE